MANKSRETVEESDKEEFGFVFCDAPKDSEQSKKKVKFKETPEVIPDVGQLCTIDGHQYHTFNKNSWIGDTDASCFIAYNDTTMYDVTKINEQIVGISGKVTATKMEKILGCVKQVDGTESIIEMYPVKYCPRATEKLFSITAFLSTGSKTQSDDTNNIQMTSNGSKVTFDCHIKTCNGWVAAVEIVTIKQEVGASMSEKVCKDKTNVSPSIDKYLCIKNVNDLHRELGHPSEKNTRATGASMGIKVVGKFEPCEACILGKAKQRNVNKTAVECSMVPGKHLYLGISSHCKSQWKVALGTKTG